MKNPVLVPLKLKFRDFIWLILFILLVTTIVLLTNNISVAQTAEASTSPKFNGGLPDASLLKKLDVPVSFDTYFMDSTFSIQVPDYLVEVNDLSADASLQFKNIFNETYFMIVPESKSESPDGHQDLKQLQDDFEFNLLVNGGLLMKSKFVQVNRHDAFQNEAQWIPENSEPLAYIVTFVDTPNTLYKIYGWTLATQKEYLEDFRKAANSFKVTTWFHSKR